MFRSLLNAFFFGNYFYALCAVALTLEATVQQGSVCHFSFLLLVFAGTVWYYTLAYQTDKTAPAQNQRTNWYITHRFLIRYTQLLFLIISIGVILFWINEYREQILLISLLQWLLLFSVPLATLFYYGINIGMKHSLRQIGWLKPFVIAFTWAGVTTLYPVLFDHIIHQSEGLMGPFGWWLFLKNFMFIAVLCIMFDIKDYATDANTNIQTFVVRKGLASTIFRILLPLSLAGLLSFLVFGVLNHFTLLRLSLNVLPFIALIVVAYSLHKRKSIFFYLFIIDGLMLFKAGCGLLAAWLS